MANALNRLAAQGWQFRSTVTAPKGFISVLLSRDVTLLPAGDEIHTESQEQITNGVAPHEVAPTHDEIESDSETVAADS